MAWKKLEALGNRSRAGDDRVLVNVKGDVTLGRAVYALMGKPTHVALFWDTDADRLGIRGARGRSRCCACAEGNCGAPNQCRLGIRGDGPEARTRPLRGEARGRVVRHRADCAGRLAAR